MIVVLLFCNAPFAQGQIHILRYNDNFTNVNNDTIQKKGFEKLKYIRLLKDTRISFGGEIREQFQYYNNQNFGDVPPTYINASTGQIWHRAMAHANIESGSKLRLFVQLGSTFRFLNPNPITPEIDENHLALHQAFIDYHFYEKWLLRFGRQEISYGNHRLLTFREGPNTRLAFDAAIIKYYSEKRKVDIFVLSPVISKSGLFDDELFKDMILGAYATEIVRPKTFLLDYYFINFNTDRRHYNYISGKENRQTYGFRVFSENPKFNYELEANYQSGKFNNLNISAYSVAADINFKLALQNKLVVGVGSNYISGDKNKNDSQLNTYNLIFSKPQYGLTAPIGATNLVNINPYIKISPTPKSNIYISNYFMWRQSKQDGTYSPGAIEVRPNPSLIFASDKRKIGNLLVLESAYFINKRFSFAFDLSYFFAGGYVKATGKGKDITYLSLKGSYKF